MPSERREDHHGDLGEVAAEDVADELADVVEDDPALAHGADDRGEVVVLQHHVGGVLGDVGAGDPHRHADVGLLERRSVVDAVAGHRHDLALALQRLDDAELVLGRDARVDRRLAGRVASRPSSSSSPSSAPVTAARVVADEAEVAGDRRGGERVVAGDHDRADAGVAAGGDGVAHLRARRVDHPLQPERT